MGEEGELRMLQGDVAERILSEAYEPVSYTHLDVYKRQMLSIMITLITGVLSLVPC